MSTQAALHITGTDAATRAPVDSWVADGVFVEGPIVDAAELTGWTLPGLVDAHCHIGYSSAGPVDLAGAEDQARTTLRSGVLALRDCGSPVDTRPLVDRDDLPILIRAGRHLARPKRYIRGLGLDLEDPAELPAAVAEQAGAGGGWVKLVGDWIDRDIGDLAPLWPDDILLDAVATAHSAGARVTAHVFGEDAIPGLLAAGIDCLEHGTGLEQDTIAAMADAGVRLVPTLINIANFPMFADAADRYPAYAKHMRDLFQRHQQVFCAAVEAGVPIHAGTDAGGYIEHGRIADELDALGAVGLSMSSVLQAASHDARAWLGLPPGEVGDSADLVIYPADPVSEPGVLRHPSAIIRAGSVAA